MSNKCIQCGVEHSDQVAKYPVGTKVASIHELKTFDGFLNVGDEGVVTGHCDDGRAMVLFQHAKSTHTFHYPEDYIILKITTIDNLFPQQPQRQDSLRDQLSDLILLANRAGLYDAADWVMKQVNAVY